MSLSQEFSIGDRVVVTEGYPGVVTDVATGIDFTDYYVELEDGLGHGWWSENELTPAPLTSTAATAVTTTEAEVSRPLAADSYPELGPLLEERPDYELALPEEEYQRLRLQGKVASKDTGKEALYLPLNQDGQHSRGAAYQAGYSDGYQGTKQEHGDLAFSAQYLLGWANGLRDRNAPEPFDTTDNLVENDPALPEMAFTPIEASHKEAVGLGDVVDLIKGDPTPTDYWAGPGRNWSYDWCFLPDAPVMMADGSERAISEIEVGDEVITHLGSVRRVTWVGSRPFEGDISRVKVFGDSTREFVATSEHRVFGGKDGQADWVPVGDLGVGDYLTRSVLTDQTPLLVDLTEPIRGGWGKSGAKGVTHVPTKASPWVFRSPEGSRHFATQEDAVEASAAYHQPRVMSLKVDESLAWLLGLYAGDGFIPKGAGHAVSFSVHLDQTRIVDRLRSVAQDYFGVPISTYADRGAVRVDIRHWALQALCGSLVGRGSHGKGFSAGVMKMPVGEQQALLEGYLDADGHHRADGGHNVSSISPVLPRQIREIRARLGGVCNQRWDSRGRGEFPNGKPSIRTEWWNGKNHLSRQHITDGQVYHQIISTEREHYVGDVWDIEVEEDHSFRAYGFNVHNCRFRRESHCWLPKELNREATDLAGYAVWVPHDRGHCRRQSWEAQQACPVPSQPGPNVPGGFTDATVPWSEGGQRDGYVDPRQRIAAKVEIEDSDGFTFHYTAAWVDVQRKGKRIYDDGHVRVLSVIMQPDGIRPEVFVTQVQGDNSVYQVEMDFVPGTFKVGAWSCTCPWNSYNWGRRVRPDWEGRACSHMMASLYAMQSQGMSGMPDIEDEVAPDWVPTTAHRKMSVVANVLLRNQQAMKGVQARLEEMGTRTAARGRLRGQVDGRVVDLDFDSGKTYYQGQEYTGEVQYPDYHPTRGLTASKKERTMPIPPDGDWLFTGGVDTEAILHDEPEPALPYTEGDVEDPEAAMEAQEATDELVDRTAATGQEGGPRKQSSTTETAAFWVVDPEDGHDVDGPFETREQAERESVWQRGDYGDGDYVIEERSDGDKKTASVKTAAAFSAAEQQQIINEGEGTQARNLASLDLTGTHYQALAPLMEEPTDDDSIFW